MAMRDTSLYILLALLIAGIGCACIPDECLRCNTAEETSADYCPVCLNDTPQCINVPPDILPKCTKDFQVSVNSTGSEAEEGDEITLTCVHNLPGLNLMFEWEKDGEEILEGRNKSQLVLEKVLPHKTGQYTCSVDSPCGSYESSPHGVTVKNNSVVLLVVCGVSALALVMIVGLAMKYKLKRDNTKHRERMKQREQAGRSDGPAPFTPRQS